jgi:multidrug efflux system membrane fusion protein
VYAVKPDSTVEARPVTISLTQGNTTVVASGVNPGDTVVTDGQDKLQTGSKIELRNANPGNAPSGKNSGSAPALGNSGS